MKYLVVFSILSIAVIAASGFVALLWPDTNE